MTSSYASTRSTRYDGLVSVPGESTVATPSLAWMRMSTRWELVDALQSTDKMRDGGRQWLPQEKGEKQRDYTDRLNRSYLLPAYTDTLGKLTGKPFSQPITVDEEGIGEQITRLLANVDNEGSDLTTFGRAIFHEALHRGLTHVLVEYPQVGELNLQQERDMGIHPYFVHVTAPELINHRLVKGRHGKYLEQIRIRQTRERLTDNMWSDEFEEIIRVITAPPQLTDEEREVFVTEFGEDAVKGTWQVYQQDDEKKKWIKTEEGFYNFDEIPLYTLYFNKHGDLEARPTMWGLAEMNLEHWQSRSDQNNLLHVARVPILFRKGFSKEELNKGLTIGAGRSVGTTNKDAEMKFVEHTGKALESGRTHLTDLEERMEVAGLQPLMRRANATLATAIIAGDSKEENELQTYARLTEAFLCVLFQKAAKMVAEEIPEGWKPQIFNEFGLSARAADDVKDLLAARVAGQISHETYLLEIKRRMLVSDQLDVQEELTRIQDEIPVSSGFDDDDDETIDSDPEE